VNFENNIVLCIPFAQSLTNFNAPNAPPVKNERAVRPLRIDDCNIIAVESLLGNTNERTAECWYSYHDEGVEKW
jgi:hypothetical protein